MPAHLENSAVATGLEKVSFHSNSKDCKECERMFKLPYNFTQDNAQNLQVRLQRFMNWELEDVQAGFREVRGTRDQIANMLWIIEKPREFKKKIYFCSTDYAKAFDCVDYKKKGGWGLKELVIPDHFPCLLRNLYAGQEVKVRTLHRTRAGSNLGNEYVKIVYCHVDYLTYMQSTSCEMWGWKNPKLESRLLEKYQPQICRIPH